MHGSTILCFIKDERNDFNHRVENMTSLTKNTEPQDAFKNGCQITHTHTCTSTDVTDRNNLNLLVIFPVFKRVKNPLQLMI